MKWRPRERDSWQFWFGCESPSPSTGTHSVSATARSTTICYIPWQYDSGLQQSLVTVHSARLQPHGSVELERVNNCDPKALGKKKKNNLAEVGVSCLIRRRYVQLHFWRLLLDCVLLRTVPQPSFMLHFTLSSRILSGPNMKISGNSDCESGSKLQLYGRIESANRLKWLWTDSLITRCNKRITSPRMCCSLLWMTNHFFPASSFIIQKSTQSEKKKNTASFIFAHLCIFYLINKCLQIPHYICLMADYCWPSLALMLFSVGK